MGLGAEMNFIHPTKTDWLSSAQLSYCDCELPINHLDLKRTGGWQPLRNSKTELWSGGGSSTWFSYSSLCGAWINKISHQGLFIIPGLYLVNYVFFLHQVTIDHYFWQIGSYCWFHCGQHMHWRLTPYRSTRCQKTPLALNENSSQLSELPSLQPFAVWF